jgi:hypothetical protein
MTREYDDSYADPVADLPPALSENERESLRRWDGPEGKRALALIDALTALVAEQAVLLVQDVASARRFAGPRG